MSALPDGSQRRSRAVFAWSVLLLASAAALNSGRADVAIGGGRYQAGDWLINYSAGFVRRGLFGQAFLAVAPSGQAALWLLLAVQVLLYGAVLAYCLWFLHASEYDWSSIALVCGPAALAFVGWDPGGFARKDSLVLVVLVLLAMARRRQQGGPASIALVSSALLLYAIAVLSWEAGALMAPAVVYLLWSPAHGAGRAAFTQAAGILAGVLAVLGLGTAIAFHGGGDSAVRICQSLREHGLDGAELCRGSIGAIDWTSGFTMQKVRNAFPLYFGYVPLVALACLPVVLTPWFRCNWRWALACAIGVAPLFAIANDYGRWTFMLVMELTICVMANGREAARSRAWTPLAAVLYVTVWGIPHWLAPDTATWPWLGALSTGSRALGSVAGLLLGLG